MRTPGGVTGVCPGAGLGGCMHAEDEQLLKPQASCFNHSSFPTKSLLFYCSPLDAFLERGPRAELGQGGDFPRASQKQTTPSLLFTDVSRWVLPPGTAGEVFWLSCCI